LATVGISPGFIDDQGVFYMSPGGVFAITKPINGAAANRRKPSKDRFPATAST